MKVVYHNQELNFRISYYPRGSNENYVQMKNGHMYKLINKKENPHNFIKEINERGTTYIARRVDEEGNIIEDEKERAFWFLLQTNTSRTDSIGVFVSDQLHFPSMKPTDRLIQAFYKENYKGTYLDGQTKYLRKLKQQLDYIHYENEIIMHPSTKEEPRLMFTLSNKKTKREFKNYYTACTGREFKKDFAYLTPDMIMRVKDYNKTRRVVIEAERTAHNEGDFKWKLWRLHRTRYRIVFIFSESNHDYHLEIMEQFRQETGADMSKFYITTNKKVADMELILKAQRYIQGERKPLQWNMLYTSFYQAELLNS